MKKIIFCCAVFFIFGCPLCRADGEKPGPLVTGNFDWTVSLYNGIYSQRTLGETTFSRPHQNNDKFLHGLGLSRELAEFGDYFRLELEGIFSRHHGTYDGEYQDYEELVAALLIRYDNFPWKDYIHISFAVGEGLSVTSKRAMHEVQSRGKTQRLLNYLAFELAFAAPSYPRYSLVYRIHHRSGVYGLFGGVKGASDFYVLGLRYRF
ncbi:MAG: hypothetical protein SWH68_11205 [Thermodesulfobacteriota bacterium]|nr:hypothetical protein [Thermodesulfobacteriota bacterium]